MSCVLLSGYFGFENCGDEAVLEAEVTLLRQRRPDLAIVALSATPELTARRYGIESAHRMRPRELLAALRSTDLLLSGGGSLLQDRTSLRSLLYYLSVIRLAKAMRKRVMVVAQGIGPLIRPAARRLTLRVLRGVDRITVRDEGSLEFLQAHAGGRDGPETTLTADLAFALEPLPGPRVDDALPPAPPGGGPTLAMNLRPWVGMEAFIPALAEGVLALGDGARVVTCALQADEDGPLCRRLAAAIGRGAHAPAGELRAREWMALMSRTDVVVSARLHGLIFAAAVATPAIGLAYDPKVSALQERLAAPYLETSEPTSARRFLELLGPLLESAPGERPQRESRAREMRELAARNADIALELLPR